MFDVLLLLSVTRWLFQGSDNEGGSRRDNRHGGLTILDGESDCDAKTFPVASCFCNIFTNFLGRETEGTNLGRERGGGTDFTACGAKVAFQLVSRGSYSQ